MSGTRRAGTSSCSITRTSSAPSFRPGASPRATTPRPPAGACRSTGSAGARWPTTTPTSTTAPGTATTGSARAATIIRRNACGPGRTTTGRSGRITPAAAGPLTPTGPGVRFRARTTASHPRYGRGLCPNVTIGALRSYQDRVYLERGEIDPNTGRACNGEDAVRRLRRPVQSAARKVRGAAGRRTAGGIAGGAPALRPVAGLHGQRRVDRERRRSGHQRGAGGAGEAHGLLGRWRGAPRSRSPGPTRATPASSGTTTGTWPPARPGAAGRTSRTARRAGRTRRPTRCAA